MNELITFFTDLIGQGAAVFTVVIAGVTIAIRVTVKRKKFFKAVWKWIKNLF